MPKFIYHLILWSVLLLIGYESYMYINTLFVTDLDAESSNLTPAMNQENMKYILSLIFVLVGTLICNIRQIVHTLDSNHMNTVWYGIFCGMMCSIVNFVTCISYTLIVLLFATNTLAGISVAIPYALASAVIGVHSVPYSTLGIGYMINTFVETYIDRDQFIRAKRKTITSFIQKSNI